MIPTPGLRRWVLGGVLFAGLSPVFAAPLQLTLLARLPVPPTAVTPGTPFGGLSGIDYAPDSQTLYAVSDDSHADHSGRVYRYTMAWTNDHLVLTPQPLLWLKKKDTHPQASADFETITRVGSSEIAVGSEAGPWIRRFSLRTGIETGRLPLPDVFLPADAQGNSVRPGAAGQVRGVHDNRAFEGISEDAATDRLYALCETSVIQDATPGEARSGGATLFGSTRCRLVAFDAAGTTPRAGIQRVYPIAAGGFFASASDVLSLGGGQLLVLERRLIGLGTGTGNYAFRLCRIDFNQNDATDVASFPTLKDVDYTPLRKQVVYDSSDEDLRAVDNVEGLCWGPRIHGQQTLLLISDNNFASNQKTELLVFTCSP